MLQRYLALFAGLWLAMVTGAGARAAQKPEEATASVPALTQFHPVIYQIWHEAWPKKNAALLRQMLSDVQQGVARISAAQLPGILRERKSAWDLGVARLQKAGRDYASAVHAGEDAPLLAAAETLHSAFEALARSIRPPLKELDAFHAVLYMLYHHYIPEKRMDQVRTSVGELKQTMDALNAAQLPERLRSRDREFQIGRGRLAGAVRALEDSVASGDEAAIGAALEAVHVHYQRLEKVLE